MKIALKELRETMVILKIALKKKYLVGNLASSGLDECNQLISIFVKCVVTASKNTN